MVLDEELVLAKLCELKIWAINNNIDATVFRATLKFALMADTYMLNQYPKDLVEQVEKESSRLALKWFSDYAPEKPIQIYKQANIKVLVLI